MLEIEPLHYTSTQTFLGRPGDSITIASKEGDWLHFRKVSMAFGQWLISKRGDNRFVERLGNTDFRSFFDGWPFRDMPSDLSVAPEDRSVYEAIKQAIPLAWGAFAAAPVRYRVEPSEQWVYLDGINDLGEPMKAPIPKPKKASSAAARKERETVRRLREAGFQID